VLLVAHAYRQVLGGGEGQINWENYESDRVTLADLMNI
jgi:hypothetical protein